jgi:thioredoxin 1
MMKFNELIRSEQPVLVDFYAEWCSPCHMMGLILKEVISKVNGKARIIKINIDKNPAAAARYGVRSVPTLIVFKKGEIRWRSSGVVPKDQLIGILQNNF